MGMFDQNGRQASKADGAGFWAGVCRRFTPPLPLAFERWDDTRRSSWPGGPDRTDDVVAVLQRTDRPDARAVLIVEIETEPERFIFHRLGIYELMLSMEVAARPRAETEEEPAVGSVLIHLTGQRTTTRLRLNPPGTTNGTTVEPLIINLCQEDAAATLADIDAGGTALCILPWIPLMKGGGAPALIEEWKRVAMKEPRADQRAIYRDMALVFAELIKEQVNWQQGLEGWEMKESQYILNYIRRGEQKGELQKGRADLLRVLRVKFGAPAPEDVRLSIEGTNDPEILVRWLDVAVLAGSLADFCTAMKAAAQP